ncbi:hypothetical protein SAICODRAFT_28594 [Saitoella complicata NRRL Y-17804]|uniref:uncharacterized protein n=1 Tax=Saitoella complicata (strain BCRC 22490 / CBS 7301 / JCM 7358 / NBRC 10748 / NRRL Y-17804) TaxID=698492 RepID=UPI000867B225|nr:uncharacterized protein SAICODRAFT_28594 [Saitoella complicata NRRL Y-17804]ODQ56449.1 hypothetical protein SAICODRAFT_28594 [Saitoella complicata NRRL Y-17804]
MARKKIQIKKIEDPKVKTVTFARRRNGLLKKAHELSVLCDTRIAIVMFDAKDMCHVYHTDKNSSADEQLKRYLNKSFATIDPRRNYETPDFAQEDPSTAPVWRVQQSNVAIVNTYEVLPAPGQGESNDGGNGEDDGDDMDGSEQLCVRSKRSYHTNESQPDVQSPFFQGLQSPPVSDVVTPVAEEELFSPTAVSVSSRFSTPDHSGLCIMPESPMSSQTPVSPAASMSQHQMQWTGQSTFWPQQQQQTQQYQMMQQSVRRATIAPTTRPVLQRAQSTPVIRRSSHVMYMSQQQAIQAAAHQALMQSMPSVGDMQFQAIPMRRVSTERAQVPRSVPPQLAGHPYPNLVQRQLSQSQLPSPNPSVSGMSTIKFGAVPMVREETLSPTEEIAAPFFSSQPLPTPSQSTGMENLGLAPPQAFSHQRGLSVLDDIANFQAEIDASLALDHAMKQEDASVDAVEKWLSQDMKVETAYVPGTDLTVMDTENTNAAMMAW